jgi:hypothetical protein
MLSPAGPSVVVVLVDEWGEHPEETLIHPTILSRSEYRY